MKNSKERTPMKYIDTTIELELKSEFTSLKDLFSGLIHKHDLADANILCWVPHEVGCITQLGWESGVVDDARDMLETLVPEGKYLKHDEPGTPFRHNSHQHLRTKLVGTVSINLLVKDKELIIGKYQDIYYFSPVFDTIPEQRIICRILDLSK
jgi:thiamine phosphate synthase YjbQ (UPF0047 family)